MSGITDNRLLFIKIAVNGVNLNPVDYVYGNTGLPAIYGFGHLLQRYFAQNDCLSTMGGFNVATYEQRINVVKDGFNYKFSLSRNPHFQQGASLNKGVPIIEECKGYGKYGLVFKIHDYEDDVLEIVRHKLPLMRFAGGMIEEILDVDVFEDDEDGEQQILKRLTPGTVLMDRHQMLAEHCLENGCDVLDALFDHICILKKKYPEHKDKWFSEGKKVDSPGWLIPIFAGYQRVSRIQENLPGQRDSESRHAFVEPVVTLAEAKMPLKVASIDEMLWQMTMDEDQNYFIFQQKQDNK